MLVRYRADDAPAPRPAPKWPPTGAPYFALGPFMAVQGGGLLVDVGRHLISSRWLTGDKMRNFIFAFLALLSIAVSTSTRAEPTEKRIALVIGNGSYQTGALPTAANDAGLIAQTLQAAGFDVVGARDLDQDTL